MTGLDLLDGSVTGVDVRDGSLTAPDLARESRFTYVGEPGGPVLANDFETEVIESAELGQVRAREGSVRQVEVFWMVGVGTSIFRGPRPLSSQHPADAHHTLNCEEPPKGFENEALSLPPGAVYCESFCAFQGMTYLPVGSTLVKSGPTTIGRAPALGRVLEEFGLR